MGLRRTGAVTGLLVCLCSLPSATAGEIIGTVRLEGPVPSPSVITIEPKTGDHSTEGCGDLSKPSPRLLVDANGGIQNTVVWLESSPQPHPSSSESTAVLDQQECVFSPHVLVVPPGGSLAIRNSDPLRHNVRIFLGFKMLMHEWQPDQADDLVWRFETPGRYLVRCGVHPWMYAWVIAAEHAYYSVTDASGRFRIPNVPIGRYTLRLWHETLGEQEQVIRVGSTQRDVVVQFSQERGM